MTGILRLHSLYVASISTDLTYDNVFAATWSAAELNVGIICACMPAIRPAINRMFPRLLASTQDDRSLNTFPPGGSYYRNDSVVELTQTNKEDNHASFDEPRARTIHPTPTYPNKNGLFQLVKTSDFVSNTGGC